MKTNNLMLQFCRVTTFAAELPLTNPMTHHSVHCTNLCSKRLLGDGEGKKDRGMGIFDVLAACEKMGREPKKGMRGKRERKEGRKHLQTSPWCPPTSEPCNWLGLVECSIYLYVSIKGLFYTKL